MEHVFQKLRLGQIALLFLLAAASASARDFCSLTVLVSDAHGNKPTGVTVTLVENNGRVEIETTKNGEAKFCDLGSSGVNLTISETDHCNEVLLRNVAILWTVERTVNVIYNRDSCNADEIQSVGCAFLLRFVNEPGRSVPEVHFDPPIGSERVEQSDSHGRVLVWMKIGQTLTETAQSQGYRPEAIELNCKPSTYKEEKIIILHNNN
jgi:hypothetical protein